MTITPPFIPDNKVNVDGLLQDKKTPYLEMLNVRGYIIIIL